MAREERDYSHRSLIDKLGIAREHRICLRAVTNPALADLVEARVEQPTASVLRGRFDVILYEVNGLRDLDEIERLASHLEPAGALWILHPKGKGASPNDATVRAAGLAAGLVDNKISAYTQTHTATRYVIPVGKRRPTNG
jgi:hypothetical protein